LKIQASFSASYSQRRWAIAAGADYLNDIQGFPFVDLYPELAASRVKPVVMHSVQGMGIATRVEVAPEAIFGRVVGFFEERIGALVRAGIARERLIIDPGMGLFLGSRCEASFAVLRRLSELRALLGLPVLVSVSRKSFLRTFLGRSARASGAATLAETLPELSADTGMGVAAPPGTRKERVSKTSDALGKAFAMPGLRQRILAQEAEPLGSTPERTRAMIQSSTQLWAPAVEAATLLVE